MIEWNTHLGQLVVVVEKVSNNLIYIPIFVSSSVLLVHSSQAFEELMPRRK
jgi:hypothetical protein